MIEKKAGLHMWKLVASIFLMAAVSVHADVYKWTDNSGQVHYGDKPIDVNSAEQVSVDSIPASELTLEEKSRDEKRQRLLDAMQEDREQKRQQREKSQADKEARLRRCLALKDQLRGIQEADGVYQLDEKGNRVFLSSENREKSENQLRAQMDKYCS